MSYTPSRRSGKLRVLSSYVPRFLLRRIRRFPEALTDIAEDKFNAVISVVDISGFTQLRYARPSVGA